MRSLDFTACSNKECTKDCDRKLTNEENEWLENNANRMSYCDFNEYCNCKENKNT